MEDRRSTDHKILETLGDIKTDVGSLKTQVQITQSNNAAILRRHSDILHGKDGNNGLITVVSKLRERWKIVCWAIGVLGTAIVAQAAKLF